MKRLIIGLIRFYQKYLRDQNRSCIYHPSCSQYAILSVEKYGIFKGLYYGRKRIKRCNGALFAGGEDWP